MPIKLVLKDSPYNGLNPRAVQSIGIVEGEGDAVFSTARDEFYDVRILMKQEVVSLLSWAKRTTRILRRHMIT